MSHGTKVWLLPPRRARLLTSLTLGKSPGCGLISDFRSFAEALRAGDWALRRGEPGESFARIIHKVGDSRLVLDLPDNRPPRRAL